MPLILLSLLSRPPPALAAVEDELLATAGCRGLLPPLDGAGADGPLLALFDTFELLLPVDSPTEVVVAEAAVAALIEPLACCWLYAGEWATETDAFTSLWLIAFGCVERFRR